MKFSLIIFTVIVFLSVGCKRPKGLSFKNNVEKQIIAFQPFDNYVLFDTSTVIKEIANFYDKQVILLKPIKMPDKFFNTSAQQYLADSLITLLNQLQNDTIVEIVGLTNKPIYTAKEVNGIPYFNRNLFGMGHEPGNVCIISDFKFAIPYESVFNRRLRNVIIHEIGHNLGLPHCDNEKCVMSENNGNTLILDKSGDDYCVRCRKILRQ